jgi:hydroxymethylpyrimidine pyrophosphatase-like HAD family hydrolase
MRYRALACDYDGTLATDGVVGSDVITGLERLRASGRRLILVSGREPHDLRRVFDRVDLFDRLVLENGALVCDPSTARLSVLATAPPAELAAALMDAGVQPLSVGRVILATWAPHEETVRETIRALGLDLQVILNKGAVMVLPSGVDKATGLGAVLDELRLMPNSVVGVGDAENDLTFLALCGFAVAVANALPEVMDAADLVTAGARGAGVIELIDQLVASDLDEGAVRRSS